MDKYTSGKQIGKGGFGRAFLCSRVQDDVTCIIKKVDVTRLSFKERQKATDEANLLAKLSHPNIVRYWEGFFDGLVLCMVMDYAEGGDLSSHLLSRLEGPGAGYLDEQQVLSWLAQMTRALGYLHGRNILHRDLKPHNIFLTSSGVVKLGDFGIAKVLDSPIDLARTVTGTPSYMSPEIFQHKPYSHKADMWSLGCVLYEMVALRCAFQGGLIQILVAQAKELPPLPDRYSLEMKQLLRDLLQQDPDWRPSADEVLERPFARHSLCVQPIVSLQSPSSAATLQAPWDPMAEARMSALPLVDSGNFDVGNQDVFIHMLDTELQDILRQVGIKLARGGRSPSPLGRRMMPRHDQWNSQQNHSPLKVCAWCIGVFATIAAILVNALAPPIHFMSTRNTAQMHDVFFGEEAWVVLCKNKGPEYHPVYKRFETASRILIESASFGVVDCSGPLPSGKNIIQRFSLTNRSKTPVLFAVGAGMKPVQASPWNMDSEAALAEWAGIAVTPAASLVTSTRSLETKCLKKEHCVLILMAGQLEVAEQHALKEVMARHRSLRFVSIDSTKLEASFERRFDIKVVDGAHHVLYFTRYNSSATAKSGIPRWDVQVYSGNLGPGSMSNFLENAKNVDTSETRALKHLPTVSTRKVPKEKQR